MRVRIRVSVCGAEMETGRVDRHWLPVGLGYRSAGSTLGDRCVTGWLHKTQKDTFFSSTNLKLKSIYYKVCDFLGGGLLICKTVRPMLSVRCPVCLSVTFVHCGETVGRINTKLGMQVGLSPGHNVLHGYPTPPPNKEAHSPQLLAQVRCGQTAVWIKMPLGTEVSLGADDSVLDRYSPKKGGTAPNFWPMSIVAKWLDGSRCHLVRR